MSDLPPPITPYLEPAAKELCEATDPHPRIYEVPPEKGRDILLGLQSDTSVPRPEVDEEWVDVDAGEWGTVRTRLIRPAGTTGPLPVLFYIHGAGWVFGDDKTHDRLFRELAVGAGAAGVFPSTTGPRRPGTPRRSSRTTPWADGFWSTAPSTGSTPRGSP